MKRWTNEEINFIKKNYSKMSKKKIAIHLDRKLGSVTSKICALGITKNEHYTLQQLAYLFKFYNPVGTGRESNSKEIAEKLGKKPYNIRSRYYALRKQGKIETYSKLYKEAI